jgi:methionine-rich copper-binding protein CopC
MAIGTLAVLAISLLATSANAHPKLNSVSPTPDVSSKVSPTEIKLNFSEGVIAKFSGLELKDEAGKTIATGVPANDPRDQKQLVVPLPAPLTAGHYTVTWHAVSEDTHRVKGEYSFGVDR